MRGVLTYLAYELGEDKKPLLNLYIRTEEGDRRHIIVRDFAPHFFFKTKVSLPAILNKIGIDYKLEPAERKSLFGDALFELTYVNPKDTEDIRKLFYDHFEADIRFVWRYLIDKGIYGGVEFDGNGISPCSVSVKPRIIYFDIEVLQKRISIEGKDPIACISVIDNYKDGIKTWDLNSFKDERKMLYSFQQYLRRIDPDILAGWNITGYDLPVLTNRCKELGVRMIMDWGFYYKRTREIFDLDKGYRKLHLGECTSYSLGYVAQKELEKAKTEIGNNAIQMWAADPAEVIRINQQHVKLTKEIDDVCGVIDFFWDLKNYAGLRLLDTEYHSRIVDMLLLRKAKELGVALPSRKELDFDYEGAYCFAKPGLYGNVWIFDFESMYPSVIKQFNISPETKVLIDGKVRFSRDKIGIVPSLFDELIKKRKGIQKEMYAASGKEYDRLFRKQEVIKFLTNAIYGTFGYPRSRLADKDCAEATTKLGKGLLKFLRTEFEALKLQPIAGDTDSIFLLNIVDTDGVLNLVNVSLVPAWLSLNDIEDSSVIKFTFKKKFTRLLIRAKKNYAGLDEKGDLKVKGLGSVKSDTSDVVSNIQRTVLKGILNDEPVCDILEKEIKRIENASLSWLDVARGTRLTKNPNEYKSNAPHVRAVKWSNNNLNTSFKEGDKIMWCFCIHPKTDVVAYDYGVEIPDGYKPDIIRLINNIRMKTEPLLKMVDLSFPRSKIKKERAFRRGHSASTKNMTKLTDWMPGWLGEREK